MNKIKPLATRLAGSCSTYGREKDDFYATPPQTTKALLRAYPLKGDSFYEPCVGMGHIAEVLKEVYPQVKYYSSDLVDRGYGITGVDFLTDDVLNIVLEGKKVDWVITNPPFKYAKEFVEKSLEITNTGVAMLLKIQFLESEARREFLREHL